MKEFHVQNKALTSSISSRSWFSRAVTAAVRFSAYAPYGQAVHKIGLYPLQPYKWVQCHTPRTYLIFQEDLENLKTKPITFGPPPQSRSTPLRAASEFGAQTVVGALPSYLALRVHSFLKGEEAQPIGQFLSSYSLSSLVGSAASTMVDGALRVYEKKSFFKAVNELGQLASKSVIKSTLANTLKTALTLTTLHGIQGNHNLGHIAKTTGLSLVTSAARTALVSGLKFLKASSEARQWMRVARAASVVAAPETLGSSLVVTAALTLGEYLLFDYLEEKLA